MHAHQIGEMCHWRSIFKPLAFTVFRDSELTQVLVQSHLRNGELVNTFDKSFVRWLSCVGENGWVNLIHVFFLIIQFRGIPRDR